MPATGSQRRNNAALPPGLERRLFLLYFLIFTLVLSGFALAIHFAFVNSLQSQTSARLSTLLVAGLRSVRISGAQIVIKENVPENSLLEAGQGLQWFDSGGKLINDEGISGGHLLSTRSAPIVNTKTAKVVGSVRAFQDVAPLRAEAWQLDEILIIGGLVSLAASGLGARFLQIRSVEPIRAGYERLREFSADASHELRGPITAIKSNADAALRDAIGMRSADHERFSSISHAAQGMGNLTNDLLLLARAEEPMERDLFAVDIAESIEAAMRLYRSEFEAKNITLESHVNGGITVYGNPDQLGRIFANLIENALRYTPPGGEVRIEQSRHRDSVSIHVRDTGSGIPHEDLEKIFERFWRGESARTRSAGTGLGLAIVRALVKRHGGDISVSSKPRRGSEFVVTFPYLPPA